MGPGTESDDCRLTARVTGRVQGVGFRQFVVRHGRRLRLSGYAKNLPDGSVEVAAEGARAALQELLSALSKGPPGSNVEDVRSEWGEARGDQRGFSVDY